MGKTDQTSASSLRYLSNGSIENTSSVYSASVSCPLKRIKQKKNAHLLSTAIHYTNGHDSRNVRCTLYAQWGANSSTRTASSANSRTGVHSDTLIINNGSPGNPTGTLHCTLPPKGSKHSALHSYSATYKVWKRSDGNCGYVPAPMCFDHSGMTMPPNMKANTARFERKNPEADPYFSTTGYVANYSEQYTLPVIFPLVRDNLSNNVAPSVMVNADLYQSPASARCRLVQRDGAKLPEIIEMEWHDSTPSDHRDSGSFTGAANAATFSADTVLAVHCDLPPRSAEGIPKITYLSWDKF